VALGTLAAGALYIGAYFACVSVRFNYAMRPSGKSVGTAYAYYKVGPLLEDFVGSFFEPARLCDAYYLRPKLWEDRSQISAW
jgi:hypothetical protein